MTLIPGKAVLQEVFSRPEETEDLVRRLQGRLCPVLEGAGVRRRRHEAVVVADRGQRHQDGR